MVARVAGAGLASALLVVAWTGVYLSRQTRSSGLPQSNVTTTIEPVVYEIVTLENDTFIYMLDNDSKRDKVKEVVKPRTY